MRPLINEPGTRQKPGLEKAPAIDRRLLQRRRYLEVKVIEHRASNRRLFAKIRTRRHPIAHLELRTLGD